MRSGSFLIFIYALLFISCSSRQGNEQTDFNAGEEVNDISVAMISMKIINLPNWLKVITRPENPRSNNQIETMGIFQDTSEEDLVYVFLGSSQIDILEKYINSNDFDDEFTIPALGKPKVAYIDVLHLLDKDFTQTHRLLISHKIVDFLKWKPYFDDDLVARREHDLTTVGLGRGQDDPSVVYVFFAYDNETMAEDYFANPALKAKMEEAGVVGEIQMNRMKPLPNVQL